MRASTTKVAQAGSRALMSARGVVVRAPTQRHSEPALPSSPLSNGNALAIMTVFVAAGAISAVLSLFLMRYRFTAYLDPLSPRERYVYVVTFPIWAMWVGALLFITEYKMIDNAHDGLALAGLTYVTLASLMLLALRPKRSGEPWFDFSARNVLIGPVLCFPLIADMFINTFIIGPWKRSGEGRAAVAQQQQQQQQQSLLLLQQHKRKTSDTASLLEGYAASEGASLHQEEHPRHGQETPS